MKKIKDAFPDLNRELKFIPLGKEKPQYLNSIEIENFNNNGYIYPINIFNENQITIYRNYFDKLLKKAMSMGWNTYDINGWHKNCPIIYDLVTNRNILNYVGDLLGDDLILWGSHFFVKMPKDGKLVSWHQDASYWPLTPSKTVTVWLAIDDADEKNGAMKFIPRSHLHAQLEFEDSVSDDNNVLYQKVTEAEKFGDPPVSVILKAGQISLHSDWLLHGSGYNNSFKRRCGLTMRFASSEVKAYLGWNKNSIICKGTDKSGHWNNIPRPSSETIPIFQNNLDA